MNIEEIEKLIGNTPIKRLGESNIYVKLESYNPAGSIKDRASLYMIKGAIERGLLALGGTVIEPTSGNTGIGVAYIAQKLGYKSIIVMPEGVTRERIDLIKSYGGEVMLSRGEEGMKGAIALAEKLKEEIGNAVILGQFENPDNALAHFKTTAPEIDRYFKGDVDIIIAGVGTGGTISGLGKFFKKQSKNKIIVGVEPKESPMITKGYSGSHTIYGIGANFVPPILDRNVIDFFQTVSSEEAIEGVKELNDLYGLKLGVSSGASYFVAKKFSIVYPKKRVLFISPDGADRYASLNLYD
ncbi:MAG: cysteine synthase family protein [Clostridiales bacterium]|nr:cysteine synthase family protein [Clostridiales bacterium]